MSGGTTSAVVVDRWPLVRLGVTGVFRACGVDVVAEAAKSSEGLLLSRARGSSFLVFGSPADGLSPSTVKGAKAGADAPKVLLLIASATGAELSALFAAGADALLVASVGQPELTDAIHRIEAGERVVGAGLAPSLSSSPSTAAAEPAVPGPLTAKELEVLRLVAQGHSNKQIARALYVADATVKTHLAHIYAKLEVPGRHGALSKAVELGLIG